MRESNGDVFFLVGEAEYSADEILKTRKMTIEGVEYSLDKETFTSLMKRKDLIFGLYELSYWLFSEEERQQMIEKASPEFAKKIRHALLLGMACNADRILF